MSAGEGAAFKSEAPDVLAAWQQYMDHVEDVRARRDAMSDRYGRRLMVNRLGFGHGTRVVGFEEFDSDVPGELLGENGELRVPKKGPPFSTVVPNVRRKAGKELGAELDRLNEKGPDLPGMPPFHIDGGHRVLAPALFKHDGVLWARWSAEFTEGIDRDLWTSAPLSAYFAAQETAQAVAQAAGVTP